MPPSGGDLLPWRASGRGRWRPRRHAVIEPPSRAGQAGGGYLRGNRPRLPAPVRGGGAAGIVRQVAEGAVILPGMRRIPADVGCRDSVSEPQSDPARLADPGGHVQRRHDCARGNRQRHRDQQYPMPERMLHRGSRRRKSRRRKCRMPKADTMPQDRRCRRAGLGLARRPVAGPPAARATRRARRESGPALVTGVCLALLPGTGGGLSRIVLGRGGALRLRDRDHASRPTLLVTALPGFSGLPVTACVTGGPAHRTRHAGRAAAGADHASEAEGTAPGSGRARAAKAPISRREPLPCASGFGYICRAY